MHKRIIAAFLLLGIFVISCKAAKSNHPSKYSVNEPIGVLDLRFLLNYDYNNTDSLKAVWDALHAVSTLQGVVNRDAPNFYIKYVVTNNKSIDDYWWDMYRQPGKWLNQRTVKQFGNIDEAFSYYKNKVNGLVVYDPQVAATSNLASSIAGIENLIAVRYDKNPGSIYSKLVRMGFVEKVRLLNNDGSSIFTGKGKIIGTKLNSTGSAKNDAYHWFIENYLKTGKCNTEFAGYYIDQYWMKNPKSAPSNHHTLTNHDYFVSKKGFFFDLSPWGDEPSTDDKTQKTGEDFNTLKIMLRTAYNQNGVKKFLHIGGFPSWAFKYTQHAGGKHADVPTEWEFTKLISAYNAFKDADAIGFGAMANASFWTHYPLKKNYPQTKATISSLKDSKLLSKNGKFEKSAKKYAIFYVGDYDASSWLYQNIPSIWDDPNRGKVPLMWAISPILERRAPMAMEYLRETATKNDFFVAADNGAGYLNPGMLQAPREISNLPDGVDAWTQHNKPYYKRWDLSITGFIIDGEAPPMNNKTLKGYSTFSGDGIVPIKYAQSGLKYGMPIITYMDHDVNIMNDNPIDAAMQTLKKINDKNIPFHWFRTILKTPTWHMEVYKHIKLQNPDVILPDASSFFLLYKQYLLQNPKAASGSIKNKNTLYK